MKSLQAWLPFLKWPRLTPEGFRNEWFAGDTFSAADIQMSFPLEAAAARGGLEKKWPKVSAFLQKIHDRPAYQRALEQGGPYQLMS